MPLCIIANSGKKQYITCSLFSSKNFYGKWLLIPSEENKCWCKAEPNIESNGDRQLRLHTVEILLSMVGTLATRYGFKAAQIYLNPHLSPHLQQQYRLGDFLVKQFWGMKPITNQPSKKVKRFIIFLLRTGLLPDQTGTSLY